MVLNLEVYLIQPLEFYLVVLIQLAHIVLLLFVAGEYAYFLDVGFKKTLQNGVAERAGAAGNQ